MASGTKINRALALKLAASTILVGSVLVSCSAHGDGGRPQSLSSSASKALASGNADKALEKAEAAVALDPRNAELRKTLAQAYLANGRFASARQSLDDALALGDASARTIISLALMHVAEGRPNAAQALLEQYRETIPASDYGLAVALAGDSKAGVDVLAQLIRSGDNTAKVRQNLAFAYALDGRWREAQIMAGQDLDPKVAEGRIAEWARIAHPEAHVQRVASVLGVTPVAGDPGQPVMLALSATPSMGETATQIGQQALASAAGPIELPPVEDTPMELAGVESVPVPASELQDAPASAPAPVHAEAAPAVAPAASGAIVAPLMTAREIVQPLPASYRRKAVRKLRADQTAKRQMIVEQEPVRTAAAAPRAPAPKAAPAKAAPAPATFQKASFSPVSNGAFAVQLGVFSSAANANRAWAGYSAKHKDLAAFSKVAVPTTVGARTLHRLTANGFADEKSARAMCAQVRSAGGECIIARAVTTKPAGTQIAARR
ncbi:tetratricopeptide repeat protein [Blastomonas natatoria]|uniref:Tetratricopeptide repeat protein n=1 Tax=Blastomonas natatoria TaxID=34015 RepID=A0A2V3VBT0_9SPHN|nr:SPOR domain-containing protein [Blastomonas natatoria]PXW77615.1 tetratricopeptide repeat protein [Blastomonas natatoria]